MNCSCRVFLVLSLVLGTAAVSAQQGSQTRDRDQLHRTAPTQAQTQQRSIYGWELMSPQERNQYQERMRKATTEQERERIRAEHHERMQERARERGVSIPDDPPRKGASPSGGMGPSGGRGPGGGTGPSGGTGPGGRGR